MSQHAHALLQAIEQTHTIVASGDRERLYDFHIGQGQRVQLER